MQPISPIYFIDYSKISDTLMWLDMDHSLKFCVTLKKYDNGNENNFHKEYTYLNTSNNTMNISIVRNYNFYFLLEDKKNKTTGSVAFRPGDVELFKMVINNNIYPWFIGRSRVYEKKDGCLIVKGKAKVQFPLNNQNYIEISPIVIEFENSSEQKEGIRLVINRSDNYFDITIDKFMEFSYIMCNTDMVNAAMNMLTYVKSKPYGVNMVDIHNNTQWNRNSNYNSGNSNNGGKSGFFK